MMLREAQAGLLEAPAPPRGAIEFCQIASPAARALAQAHWKL